MKSGNVIFLNGSSSAGKTTLARALQQLMPDPYHCLSLDQFRDGMADRYRGFNSPANSPGFNGMNVVPGEKEGRRITNIQFGELGERMLHSMRLAMAEFALSGQHIIIDDLIFRPDYLQDYVQVFKNSPVWFVGVHCDIKILRQREAVRPGRFPGTAESHYQSVHAHGCDYDLEIDTSHHTPSECAQRVVERLNQTPTAFSDFRNKHSRTAD